MKLFLIEYAWHAASPESSVVLAKNKDRAVEIARCEMSAVSEIWIEVDELPDRGSYYETEYTIKEIDTSKESLIYTGNYCC